MRSTLTRPHRTDEFHTRLRAARSHDTQERPDRRVIQARRDVSDAALMLAAFGIVGVLYVFVWLFDIALSVPA